jgi:hypothetical protein
MTSESRSTPLELSQDLTPKSVDGHAVGQELVHIPGLDRLPPLALAQYLLSHFVGQILTPDLASRHATDFVGSVISVVRVSLVVS